MRLPTLLIAILINANLLLNPHKAALAAPNDANASATLQSIDRSLRIRDYDRAIDTIAKALLDSTLDDNERSALEYRRGLAHFYAERYDEAIGCFDSLLAADADGPWSEKARMRKADALVSQREFEKAAAIYAEKIDALIGTARKDELAKEYIDFADDYFKPSRTLEEPNFAKAAKFYELALQLEPSAKLAESLRHTIGSCKLAANDHNGAIAAFEDYLRRYDMTYRRYLLHTNAATALPPVGQTPGEHVFAARLGLGEAYLNRNRNKDARRVLQDLIELAAGNDEPTTATILPKAMQLLARTYGYPKPDNANDLTAGRKILAQLIEQYPISQPAIEAGFDLAAANEHRGRGDEAIAAYRTFIAFDASRLSTDETRERYAELAQQALYNIGSILAGQNKFADAIGTWNEYVAKFPNGANWSTAQRSIIDAEYRIGTIAQKEKRFDDARTAWRTFMQKYPLDERVRFILFQFGQMAFNEQSERAEAGNEPNWQVPINEWQKLVNKFPKTTEAGHAQFRIAKTLEEKVGDLEAAVKAYQKLDWSDFQARAQVRMDEMKSVRLSVHTERVFRTNEEVQLKTDIRNIDKLTVKIYRIDMEDYFRKRHMLGGVDDLDLLLIDPDEQFVHDVKDYNRFKPIALDIPIPVDGPGVFAVNISNEASELKDDNDKPQSKLEATTLVVRSDIDILVRATREQLLVFAQNMRTREPATNVNLIISNGSKAILEAQTGDDGIWQSGDQEIRDSQNALVLAVADGHVAGEGVRLRGLSASGGLKPRGYITTDRPAYQPGDLVNIRGVLRETADGQYSLPTQPEDSRLRWTLDILDAKGRVLRTDKLLLSEFGTFASSFNVAADGPVGQYKIVARRPDGPTFNGAFTVQTYQLPKAFLSFDIDERIIMRGTQLTGAVVAKYNYGEPVRDKQIEYTIQSPDGELITRVGITDKDGRVPFDFDTAPLPEEGHISLTARQADMGLAVEDAVFVAVRAFTAAISTPRDLVLAEEPVEIKLVTRDLKDKPVARAMTITALLRSRADGKWTETKVAAERVTTSDADGTARVAFTLNKGGRYVLRAEGADRNGNTVTTETSLKVSDSEDRTRLRLFTERQHYKVGETLALDVHSRIDLSKEAGNNDKAPWALITFEGDGFFDHQLVRVQPGHNAVDIPVDHAHFPNFELSAAVMTTGKLYRARRDFTVERQLTVAIKPSKETYRPREDMRVDIEVTDHLGKPIAAEVELTMVDTALLNRFADGTPPITTYFEYGARRVTSSRTGSSCTFDYRAETHAMVTEILEEAERLAEADREDELRDRIVALRAEMGRARSRRGIAQPAPAMEAAAEESELEGGYYARNANDDSRVAKTEVMRYPDNWLEISAGRRASGELPPPSAKKNRQSIGTRGGLGGGQFNGGGDSDDQLGFATLAGDLDLDGVADFGADGYLAFGTQLKSQNNLAFAQINYKAVRAYDTALAGLVATAPPRSYFPEVAYWNPRIQTDDAGKATVEIVVPDSSTTWKLTARGVTPATRCGEATTTVVSRHDFFVELLTPDALVEGDSFTPAAQVHCLTNYKGDVSLQLTIDNGKGETQTQNATLKFDGSGVKMIQFEPIVVSTTTMKLACRATTQPQPNDRSKPQVDVARRTITVEPWGMRVETHRAGVASDRQVIDMNLPAGENLHDIHMSISIGADIRRWLVEEALWTGPRWCGIEGSYQSWRIAPPRTHADTASSLLAALYAAGYVNDRTGPDAEANAAMQLNERINGLIAQLLSVQDDDGAWSWAGQARDADVWTTAHAAWALGKAQRDGYPVAEGARSKLTDWLKKQYADAKPGDTELKASLLHGLSWIDEADFGHANRLFRNRASLNSAGLSQLALTFLQIDRKQMAIEVLEDLRRRARDEQINNRACRIITTNDNSAWMQSSLEVTALTLLAQLQADPAADGVTEMVAYLEASARAEGWRPHKARGAVLAALATYYADGERERADYKLTVTVNGRQLREIVSERDGTQFIDVPTDAIAANQVQRIEFDFDGRGSFSYAVTLSGFTNSFADPKSIRRPIAWAKSRRLEPAPPMYKGRAVRPSWEVASEWGREAFFRNEARHVTVGDTIDVDVNLRRKNRKAYEEAQLDYLIVQERIPSGFRLLPNTLTGNFFDHDLRDNMITLYYGSRWNLGDLSYSLVAVTPGEYRLPPTLVRSVYQPERFHVNNSDRQLTVLPRTEQSPDEYRLSPDQRYHLGRLHFDDGKFAAAAEHLTSLTAGDWVIRDDYYKKTVRMLLTCALQTEGDGAIVDNFEILKERFPAEVLSFEETQRVAQAYANTDQHERAYLVYRAIADSSFARDAQIGATLKNEGRFLDSVDFVASLWRIYPDTPQVVSVYYALSQSLYAKASEAGNLRPARTAQRPPSRIGLMLNTIDMLETYLALYPESPVADEASYSLCNAWYELEKDDHVLALTADCIRRFPQSKWHDRFVYLQALSHFRMGSFDDALALAKQVSNATWTDEQGIERPSPNKWLALYIAGQIYHAQLDFAKAADYYQRVKDRFSDAAEAVRLFNQRFVSLPEVTIFHPTPDGYYEADDWSKALKTAGMQGAAQVAKKHTSPFARVDFRNIGEVVLQVYRVDLMKLALAEKNLNNIAGVNLAGVKPLMERTVELDENSAYLDQSVTITLDMPVDASRSPSDLDGAYLVICRGEDRVASGLVLVTPLAVEVTEDADQGRARISVVDAISREGRRDVHVKVIGTRMSQFRTGATDLRGVFIADGIAGGATAIARNPAGEFAFYRNPEATLLAKAKFNRPQAGKMAQQQMEVGQTTNYWMNCQTDNFEIQTSNGLVLDQLFDNSTKGVQVMQTR